MLVEFTVGNFLSFKERTTLSLVASAIKEHRESNTFEVRPDLALTTGAVIYGANASGKSNLLMAMLRMDVFVRQSVSDSQEGAIPWVKTYRLIEDLEKSPSLFEVVICLDNVLYRYGFEVSDKEVRSEWLFRQDKKKEDQLFLRTEGRKIDVDEKLFPEGKELFEKTKDNALFLTVIGQFNGPISNRIINWFLKEFFVLNALEDRAYGFHTKKQSLDDEHFRQIAGSLLSAADFGIENIVVSKLDIPSKISWPQEIPASIIEQLNEDRAIRVKTVHPKFNSKRVVIGTETFDLFNDESEGTKRFFCMLGPVMRALQNGGILVVDELDSSLHSKLVWRIVKLFNSEKTNPKRAQLIFTTHDTTLLSQDLLRRDQMWFAQKDRYGASSLYSLSDYELPVRNDASFERDYLKGKYGAVPNIGSELDRLIKSIHEAP